MADQPNNHPPDRPTDNFLVTVPLVENFVSQNTWESESVLGLVLEIIVAELQFVFVFLYVVYIT